MSVGMNIANPSRLLQRLRELVDRPGAGRDRKIYAGFTHDELQRVIAGLESEEWAEEMCAASQPPDFEQLERGLGVLTMEPRMDATGNVSLALVRRLGSENDR